MANRLPAVIPVARAAKQYGLSSQTLRRWLAAEKGYRFTDRTRRLVFQADVVDVISRHIVERGGAAR